MRSRYVFFVLCFAILISSEGMRAQVQPGTPRGPVRITLDEAVSLALAHNHALAAARTTIQQSQAQEITANLRPNPVLLSDAQFLPIFNPNRWTADYTDQSAQ
ncbi:MAG TPA: hypothetical protein VLY22_01365, partial [Candidatus Nitrosotalea sp.]|nr:hypothetical protein [Candidatus Nitrosotalea sp.]